MPNRLRLIGAAFASRSCCGRVCQLHRAVSRECASEPVMWRSPLPHLHRDWGSPRPHLQRDWARPGHICTGTGAALPLCMPRCPNDRTADALLSVDYCAPAALNVSHWQAQAALFAHGPRSDALLEAEHADGFKLLYPNAGASKYAPLFMRGELPRYDRAFSEWARDEPL
jgi:hypothetical protein